MNKLIFRGGFCKISSLNTKNKQVETLNLDESSCLEALISEKHSISETSPHFLAGREQTKPKFSCRNQEFAKSKIQFGFVQAHL